MEAFDAGYVADSFSWWCGNGGDGTAGYAWVGAMCDDPYNTNINEWQENTLRSAYVSIKKYLYTTILSLIQFSLPGILSLYIIELLTTNIFRFLLTSLVII